jgi:hypothetical protein
MDTPEKRFRFLSAEEFAALTPEQKLEYVSAAFDALHRLNEAFRPPANPVRFGE